MEKHPPAQYHANDYFTSMELTFGEGIDLADVKKLQAAMKATELANALCANNNRKCQWRDGLEPRIGASAKRSVQLNGEAKGYPATAIMEPLEMNKAINANISELKTILSGLDGEAKMTNQPVENVNQTELDAPKAPESAPTPAPKATPARKNPKRAAAAATAPLPPVVDTTDDQEVVE